MVFIAWAFGVPLLFHPWWVVLLFYATTSLVLGTTLAVVFMLAHCVEEAEFPELPPETVRLPRPWAVHQVQTTVDFARGNRLLTWYVGGLNFQIEHHLFPHICHVHYPRIAEIVRGDVRRVRRALHRARQLQGRARFTLALAPPHGSRDTSPGREPVSALGARRATTASPRCAPELRTAAGVEVPPAARAIAVVVLVGVIGTPWRVTTRDQMSRAADRSPGTSPSRPGLRARHP